MQTDPRSHGLWAMSAPPAPPTTVLDEALDADVVIIGGGFTGTSAALHLAEAGRSVVLLEATAIGHGASGRNAGLVNAGLWVLPEVVLQALGPERGDRLLTLLGDGPRRVFDLVARHGIACEAEPAGTLHCGVGAKGVAELRAREAQWQARGAPVTFLGAAETAAKTGTTRYPAALFDRRSGTIQPLAYVRGLATAAIAAGARLFTGSAVTASEPVGERWRVRTATGSVTAGTVVVATDAYSHGPWTGLRTEQVHLPYFNVATAPLSDNLRRSILPDRQGAWDTKAVLTHFRLDQRGRLIVGSVGALSGTGTAIHRGWALRQIRRLFPQLSDTLAFDAAWYGMIGMTDDSMPRFHRLAPNMISISGYNGRGIAPGTVFGSLIADLILGRITQDELPLPVSHVVPARFRRTREAVYDIGSQLAHLPGSPA